jgi:pentatricopeptide repeat protein
MLQEVGKYYNEMLATGCQPDITLYNIVLGAYGREGYSVQAAILFRKMIAQGVTPDAISYNTMIQTYCKANQLADAESVYDQMTRAGFSPEKITRAALQQAGLKYTTENRIHLSRKERGVRWTPKLLRKL